MTLTEQLAADQHAVAEAETAPQAAKDKVTADQSAVDAVAPHVTWLQEIEAAAAKYGAEAEAEFASLVARGRALLNI
jgi:hypothetical protein